MQTLLRSIALGLIVLCSLAVFVQAEEATSPEEIKSVYEKMTGKPVPEGHTLKPTFYQDAYARGRLQTITPLNEKGQPDGLEVFKEKFGWGMTRSIEYVNGVKDGAEREYTRVKITVKDKRGRKKEQHVRRTITEIPWVKGKVDGVKKTWYGDGTLKSEVPYKDGVVHGESKVYDKEGKAYRITPNKNGKRHGIMREFYTQTGKAKKEIPFVDGQAHGIAKEYYTSGQLRRETECVEGKFHGIQKEYNEDGKLNKIRYWLNDDPVSKREYENATKND